jgi:hypothetical protein
MRRALLIALCAASIAAAGRAEDAPSPHRSTDPDMCAVCHEPDMSLSRSKVETCTLCHAVTIHAGANQHLRAEVATVSRIVDGAPAGQPKLPLTNDGTIWCGTCHVYHDPSFSDPPWQPEGWVPPDTGFSAAVRSGILKRSEEVARSFAAPTPGLSFAARGTRALRMPVADGALCRSCHARLP